MNKGKTNYTFQFNANPSEVDSLVKAWLQANKFSWTNKYGEDFYYFNDPVLYGKRGFQYKIEGQQISVDAWTIGIGKKFFMLDSGAVNNMAGNSYKDILQNLFNSISQLEENGGASESSVSDSVSQTASEQSQVSGFAQEFEAQDMAKKEKFCVVGFILSIMGLLISLIGLRLGVIIYILDFYFASMGLKTKKKGMAIATIVLSILSILITIFWLWISM
ncbi:hypothetical protein CIY_00800 [Butyrivibrio fibrisolvens 16/4]|nr:hypothetical protein CIY_00800 [Butyrivibrio fibrisolvens 16/4]